MFSKLSSPRSATRMTRCTGKRAARFQHGLHGLGLCHVARVNGVHERQPFGGLHDTEHELPGDAASLLVQPKGAQVVVNLPLAMDAHRRQVKKTIARS